MAIQVSNLSDGETIGYSLPLLIGEVDTSCNQTVIDVHCDSGAPSVSWPVVYGCFKVLVQLNEGQNTIRLDCDDNQLELKLTYKCLDLQRFVRPIYIRCCDDDSRFQAPVGEDCSAESAKKRIALGAQLIQTFTAEKLHEHGLGRHTFRIETNSKGEPLCHVFTTNLTLLEAQSKDGGELWNHFAKEVMSSDFADKDNCKWYAFMSFTRYNPPRDGHRPKSHADVLRYTRGHTALGGGGLALFGTGNLHTWAQSLEEIVPKFTDDRKIDRTLLMDDSAYREFYWANYATGLGASLHELGHTMDLAHTNTGIMGRGFDDLNKVFVIPGSKPVKQMQQKHTGSQNPTLSNQSKSHTSRSKCTSDDQRQPIIVQVETSFHEQPLAVLQKLTVENNDGSVVSKQIVVDTRGGQREEHSLKETLKELQLSRQSSTLSNTNSGTSTPKSASSVSTPTTPVRLPLSPPRDIVGSPHPEIKFLDGGAHWYRSSAVLLKYHKWLRDPNPEKNNSKLLYDRGTILADCGLRLAELRTIPEGVVFHHWEFLQDKPPLEFKLDRTEVASLSKDAKEVTLVAIDGGGNVLKTKVIVEDI